VHLVCRIQQSIRACICISLCRLVSLWSLGPSLGPSGCRHCPSLVYACNHPFFRPCVRLLVPWPSCRCVSPSVRPSVRQSVGPSICVDSSLLVTLQRFLNMMLFGMFCWRRPMCKLRLCETSPASPSSCQPTFHGTSCRTHGSLEGVWRFASMLSILAHSGRRFASLLAGDCPLERPYKYYFFAVLVFGRMLLCSFRADFRYHLVKYQQSSSEIIRARASVPFRVPLSFHVQKFCAFRMARPFRGYRAVETLSGARAASWPRFYTWHICHRLASSYKNATVFEL
jgi:hypothetical protein